MTDSTSACAQPDTTPSATPTTSAPRLLVKFRWDCGRGGKVEGLFVTTQAEIDAAAGKFVQFGEILGKHSDVCGRFEPTDTSVVTTDQAFIDQLVSLLGTRVSGYCPYDYVRGEDDE